MQFDCQKENKFLKNNNNNNNNLIPGAAPARLEMVTPNSLSEMYLFLELRMFS